MIDVSENRRKCTVCTQHSLWLNPSLPLAHEMLILWGESKASDSEIRRMKQSFKVLEEDESKASFTWLVGNGWSNRCVVSTAFMGKQCLALRPCYDPITGDGPA